jgi:hypothetical protein
MTRILPAALLIATATAAWAGEPSPSAKGLRMSLHLERSRFLAGEAIPLEVVIRNESDAEVFLGMSAEDMGSFDFVVRYVGGGLTQAGRMPITKYGAWRLGPFDAAKNIPIRLKPGEERRYRVPIQRMVDMTLGGTYTIVAVRCVPGRFRHDTEGRLLPPDGVARVEVVSDERTVEVAEPPPPG